MNILGKKIESLTKEINFSREIEDIKKKQMEIIRLKSTTLETKISMDGFPSRIKGQRNK